MSERLTDGELRAILGHCEGRSDVECLALSVREVRALCLEVQEWRGGRVSCSCPGAGKGTTRYRCVDCGGIR